MEEQIKFDAGGTVQCGVVSTVADLLSSLDSTPITWYAVTGWGTYSVDQRAATACIVASKALTGGSGSMPDYQGPAALVHDGGDRMYGSRQERLRRAATRQFNGFGDRVTPVYLTQLQDGDRIYPELTAADYIAGYIRSQLPEAGIEGLGYNIQRIDNSWSVSDDPPCTLYSLRSRDRRQSQRRHDRAAAWIEGRRPSTDDVWGSQPLQSLANRLQSDVVREYLLNDNGKGTAGRQHTCAVTAHAYQASPRHKGKGAACVLIQN